MEHMDTDEQQTFIKADEVISSRSGQVLLRHTVLKADHFPACHNTKLTPILEGAPNFRQASVALLTAHDHSMTHAHNMCSHDGHTLDISSVSLLHAYYFDVD